MLLHNNNNVTKNYVLLKLVTHFSVTQKLRIAKLILLILCIELVAPSAKFTNFMNFKEICLTFT